MELNLTWSDFEKFLPICEDVFDKFDWQNCQERSEIQLSLLSQIPIQPFSLKLPLLNFPLLSEALSNPSYEVCQFASDLFSSLWRVKSEESLPSNYRMKKFFPKLELLDDGFSGSAYLAQLFRSNGDPKLVLKTYHPGISRRIFIHEAFVAMYGTNRLRKTIPNFAFTYGAFYAGAVDVPTWCQQSAIDISDSSVEIGTRSPFLLQEAISPSQSFASFLERCSVSQLRRCLLQIFLALNVAHKEISFTHFDLHAENVLVSSLPQSDLKRFLRYPFLDEYLYIPVEEIAVMIDFGRSHIHFGELAFPCAENIPEICTAGEGGSFPLYDVFVLIVNSMERLHSSSPNFQYLASLLGYFTQEDPVALQKFVIEGPYGPIFPYNQKTHISIEPFISFLISGLDFSSLPEGGIVLNSGNQPVLPPDVLERTFFSAKEPDFFLTYDAHLFGGPLPDFPQERVSKVSELLSNLIQQAQSGLAALNKRSLIQTPGPTLLRDLPIFDILEQNREFVRISDLSFRARVLSGILKEKQESVQQIRSTIRELRNRVFWLKQSLDQISQPDEGQEILLSQLSNSLLAVSP